MVLTVWFGRVVPGWTLRALGHMVAWAVSEFAAHPVLPGRLPHLSFVSVGGPDHLCRCPHRSSLPCCYTRCWCILVLAWVLRLASGGLLGSFPAGLPVASSALARGCPCGLCGRLCHWCAFLRPCPRSRLSCPLPPDGGFSF